MPFELLAAGVVPQHGAFQPGEGSHADSPIDDVHAPSTCAQGRLLVPLKKGFAPGAPFRGP